MDRATNEQKDSLLDHNQPKQQYFNTNNKIEKSLQKIIDKKYTTNQQKFVYKKTCFKH